MATATENPTEQSMTTLVSGIVGDLHDLVKQQMELTRREIGEDFRKSKEAARLLVLGLGMLTLGAFMLSLTLALLLWWLSSPAGADPARIPLWACFGIVGVVFGAIGWPLTTAGQKEFDSVHLLPNTTTPVGSTTNG
jgi:hypothetical protein